MDKEIRIPMVTIDDHTGDKAIKGYTTITLDKSLSRVEAELALIGVAVTLLNHVAPELALTAIEDLLESFQRPVTLTPSRVH